MKWLNGFYFDVEAPEGAVEITDEYYNELINGQALGLTIDDKDGFPVLVDHRPSKEEIEKHKLNLLYIPSETQSLKFFAKAYLAANLPKETDEKLMVSGLYDTFDPNNPKVRVVGELVNSNGQTYECTQAHDENIYPDINPDNPQTWYSFYKLLHAKSKETARPWKKPLYGQSDQYLEGEYAAFEKGEIARALQNTVYSLYEVPSHWEVVA